MSINHDEIKKLLESRQFTQGQIAEMVNCNISTIQRDAKKFNLGIGQGIKHFWKFETLDEHISYLLGIIITDGTIKKKHHTNKTSSICIYSTTPEIIYHSKKCLINIGLKDAISIQKRPARHKLGNKDGYELHIYSVLFARWIKEKTRNKIRIPDILFAGSIKSKLAFIAGIIDGDGSVSKSGCIRIRATGVWVKQLENVLYSLGISTGGYSIARILTSGKEYIRISINRSDYINRNGTCYHPQKRKRLFTGKDTRERKQITPEKTLCPVCKSSMMSISSKSCRKCYLTSDRFHNHLKAISKKGNQAANIARWGTDHLKS